MPEKVAISPEELEKFYQKVKKDTEDAGYFLNPDKEMALALLEGLLVNNARYGYPSCPCRLAVEKADLDRDIVCPCDYRDADIGEYGGCYCGLYVSEKVAKGEQKLSSIPERRPSEEIRIQRMQEIQAPTAMDSFSCGDDKDVQRRNMTGTFTPKLPVWRCVVCGYLCARDNPPGICPICKAKQDRFLRFL